MNRLCRAAAALVLAMAVSGCGTVSYYAQSVGGHLAVLHAAKPIDDWLGDPGISPTLRERLQKVREIRAYAVKALDLPDNASYRSYADLHRPFVVYNVFAAPRLSLDLKKWCFPVAGCVTYRGYFNKASADAYAASLKAEGFDVQVAGVPAYSTLGFTDDPVLSTFIGYPEGEVARLIFHELAHQKVYAPGDSTFNESFATTVEEEGVNRWLATQTDPVLIARYRQYAARKDAFLKLVVQTRDELARAYATAANDEAKLQAKQEAIARLHANYAAALNDSHSPLFNFHGYDRYFVQDLNNAHLAAIATYTQRMPAFVKLLKKEGGDLRRFYRAVKALAALPQEQRDRALDDLDPAGATGSGRPA